MFTKEDLKTLMQAEAAPAVSIYMPAHVAGREIRQDPIRLKNLLADAEARLIDEYGMRRPEAASLLQPGHALVEDADFWRHQSTGLALFLAPGVMHSHRVPLDFEEALYLGVRFQVRPLLPLLADDGRFYLLSLSLSSVRLFEGSRFALDEYRPEELPKGLSEVLAETDFGNDLGFHSTGSADLRAGGRGTAGLRHSLGESSEDLLDDELREFFRRVANAIDQMLTADAAPLVLAADERWQGLFRQADKYRWLVDEGITANPDSLSDDELHRRAYAIMEKHFSERRAKAVDHYNSLAQDGDGRAPHEVSDIVPHACFGRVDVLFVADDLPSWGRLDADRARAEVHDVRQDGDEDLLDRAAVETLMTGGTVYAVPHRDMPSGTPAAAILRY